MIFHFVNSSLLFQGPHRGAGELRRVFFRLSFLLPFSIFFFNTLHFPHSSFSTLRIFYTPRFPHFAFSTFRVFHTPHSAFSTEPSPNDNFRSRKSDSKFSLLTQNRISGVLNMLKLNYQFGIYQFFASFLQTKRKCSKLNYFLRGQNSLAGRGSYFYNVTFICLIF